MYFRSTLFLLFACLLHSNDLYGQTSPTISAELKARFDEPLSVQWVHTFKGVWQNFYPLVIVLGYDGTTYHGTMHLQTGDLSFDLEGYQQDGKAMIQEIDQTGRTSGYLVVEIVDGRMTGQWWSVDFSRTATLLLRNEEVVELRKFEPELMVYDGSIASTRVSLVIQREESDLLSGFCTLDKNKELYRLTGRCEEEACDKMRFEMRSADGNIRHLQGTLQRNATLRAQLSFDHGETQVGTVNLMKRYPMHRLLYANYVGNVDCLYPVLSEPSFDIWLKTQVETWYTDIRSHLDSLQTASGIPGPDERWSMQASAWIDFTLLSSEKISGILTMYNPNRQGYDRSAFIFDTKNGKPLSIRDLSRKSQFETVLCTKAMLVKESDSDDPAYLTWLEAADFHHISLAPDGFVLFTDFDPTYGDTWVKLQYVDYTEALKRNTFVFEMMNK